MRLLIFLFSISAIIACQTEQAPPSDVTQPTESSGTNETSTPTETSVDRSYVNINVNSQGCVNQSNADIEIEYLIADHLVKNMHWNCASRSIPANGFYHQIDALAIYDYDKQCFMSKKNAFGDPDFDWGLAECSEVLLNPDVPQVHAHFGIVKITTDYTTFTPTIILSAEITNDGTMPFIAGTLVYNQPKGDGTYMEIPYPIPSLLVGQSITIKVKNWMTMPGEIPRLVINDLLENEIDRWYQPFEVVLE